MVVTQLRRVTNPSTQDLGRFPPVNWADNIAVQFDGELWVRVTGIELNVLRRTQEPRLRDVDVIPQLWSDIEVERDALSNHCQGITMDDEDQFVMDVLTPDSRTTRKPLTDGELKTMLFPST